MGLHYGFGGYGRRCSGLCTASAADGGLMTVWPLGRSQYDDPSNSRVLCIAWRQSKHPKVVGDPQSDICYHNNSVYPW